VTLGVACYGLLVGSGALIVIGLLGSVGIGAAMAVRARDSIRTAEAAYSRLDRALSESEQARDELAASNKDLARANLELQVMHTAFGDLLNLADERSSGRMRELIEDAGDELAELLEEKMEQRRPR
jgi:biopolymer transport protein ExbB/TolQ